MNNHSASAERRRHPRIHEHLPFTLKAEGFDTVTHTINVSCLGAYCQLDKRIPLMTHLKIALALPSADQKKDFEYVECSGVVVRVEEGGSESHRGSVYNTAIYFSEIRESEREKIVRLVENRGGQPNKSHPQS
jgi:c-di-GMP-binding flagellar brake protein YcgR